jgi:ankyrin repeat protein
MGCAASKASEDAVAATPDNNVPKEQVPAPAPEKETPEVESAQEEQQEEQIAENEASSQHQDQSTLAGPEEAEKEEEDLPPYMKNSSDEPADETNQIEKVEEEEEEEHAEDTNAIEKRPPKPSHLLDDLESDSDDDSVSLGTNQFEFPGNADNQEPDVADSTASAEETDTDTESDRQEEESSSTNDENVGIEPTTFDDEGLPFGRRSDTDSGDKTPNVPFREPSEEFDRETNGRLPGLPERRAENGSLLGSFDLDSPDSLVYETRNKNSGRRPDALGGSDHNAYSRDKAPGIPGRTGRRSTSSDKDSDTAPSIGISTSFDKKPSMPSREGSAGDVTSNTNSELEDGARPLGKSGRSTSLDDMRESGRRSSLVDLQVGTDIEKLGGDSFDDVDHTNLYAFKRPDRVEKQERKVDMLVQAVPSDGKSSRPNFAQGLQEGELLVHSDDESLGHSEPDLFQFLRNTPRRSHSDPDPEKNDSLNFGGMQHRQGSKKKKKKKEPPPKEPAKKKKLTQAEKFFGLLNHDPASSEIVDEVAIREAIEQNHRICERQYEFEGIDSPECYPFIPVCAWVADYETVKLCYEAHPEAMGYNDESIGTPLHYASAYRAPPEVIKFLCAKRPRLASMSNEWGQSPLHLACRSKPCAKTIELLLKRDKNVLGMADRDGMLPLHHACETDADAGVIELLVKGNRDAVMVQSSTGFLPLHLAILRGAPLTTVQTLVGGGKSSLHSMDLDGQTALHIALTVPTSDEILKFLIEQGPRTLSVKSKSGQKPLDLALINRPEELELHKLLDSDL